MGLIQFKSGGGGVRRDKSCGGGGGGPGKRQEYGVMGVKRSKNKG